MVFSSMPITLLFLTQILLISFPCISTSTMFNPNSDHNKLVYTHCPNQTIQTSKLLSPLLQELVEKSSKSKFYETNLGDDTTAISALFQCKNYLTNQACHDCVNNLSNISKIICAETIPARVQLSGCYLHYDYEPDHEAAGGPARALVRYDLQHKICGEPIADLGGFQEVRYGAFEALLSCVTESGSHGYCDMRYESMHVVAQCEGSLGDCECGKCVTSAAQVAQDECPDSISGEVYMGNCYLNYVYEADQLPGYFVQGKGKGIASAKLVAIVVGGGAALFAGVLCCLCIRASRKKHDDW